MHEDADAVIAQQMMDLWCQVLVHYLSKCFRMSEAVREADEAVRAFGERFKTK